MWFIGYSIGKKNNSNNANNNQTSALEEKITILTNNIEEKDKCISEHIEEIKQIFESGITLWHLENNVTPLDYSVSNNPV